jgi:hypothetical protein
MTPLHWTHEDFERMSWHDNHVHALRIVEGRHGAGELLLVSAALVPFSIHAIERRDEVRERYVAQVWKIAVNWPVGEITFEADGFEQRSTGEAVLTDLQVLSPAQRHGA